MIGDNNQFVCVKIMMMFEASIVTKRIFEKWKWLAPQIQNCKLQSGIVQQYKQQKATVGKFCFFYSFKGNAWQRGCKTLVDHFQKVVMNDFD